MSAQNRATTLLREQFKQGHEFLEGTMQDVTSEMAHWLPPGKAQTLGANYAHVLISEDFLVNGLLKGAAPLLASTQAGKVGVSELPPQAPPPLE